MRVVLSVAVCVCCMAMCCTAQERLVGGTLSRGLTWFSGGMTPNNQPTTVGTIDVGFGVGTAYDVGFFLEFFRQGGDTSSLFSLHTDATVSYHSILYQLSEPRTGAGQCYQHNLYNILLFDVSARALAKLFLNRTGSSRWYLTAGPRVSYNLGVIDNESNIFACFTTDTLPFALDAADTFLPDLEFGVVGGVGAEIMAGRNLVISIDFVTDIGLLSSDAEYVGHESEITPSPLMASLEFLSAKTVTLALRVGLGTTF